MSLGIEDEEHREWKEGKRRKESKGPERRYGGRGEKGGMKREREGKKKTQISQWNFIMWLPNRS